jgi:hypothetical protein
MTGQQSRDVGGIMLSVGVHEDDHVAGGSAGAALDRGAVALGVGVTNHLSAVLSCCVTCLVGRAVVNHNNLAVHSYFRKDCD